MQVACANTSTAVSQAAVDREQRERQLLAKRRHELESLHERRNEAQAQFDQSKRDIITHVGNDPLKLPAEQAFDIITLLENAVSVQGERNARLKKEKATLSLNLKACHDRLKTAADEVEKLQIITGYNPSRATFRAPADVQEEIDTIKRYIYVLQSELKKARTISEKKTQTVLDLSKRVDQRKALQEEIYQLHNQVRVAALEIDEATRRIEEVRHRHESEDKTITKVSGSRDLVPVTSLSEDVSYLRDEKDNIDSELTQQVRIIAAQRYRTQSLRTRLATLQSCLEDVGLNQTVQKTYKRALATIEEDTPAVVQDPELVVPAEEYVPSEMYELARSALDELERSVAVKNVLVAERDNTVESLDQKVELLQLRLHEDECQREYDKLVLEEKMEQERKELEAREQYIREGLDALNTENAKMKRMLLSAK
eukprot:PhM_4_TR10732/c0_g1_i1/m.67320